MQLNTDPRDQAAHDFLHQHPTLAARPVLAALLSVLTADIQRTLADLAPARKGGGRRVRDQGLGAALALDPPTLIRDLIEDHRDALEEIGPIYYELSGTDDALGSYWLDEAQAAILAMRIDTPAARRVQTVLAQMLLRAAG